MLAEDSYLIRNQKIKLFLSKSFLSLFLYSIVEWRQQTDIKDNARQTDNDEKKFELLLVAQNVAKPRG